MEQKSAYDADNLILLAREVAEEQGIAVSPFDLITRKDDDVAALRRKVIAIRLKTRPGSSDDTAAVKAEEENGARLQVEKKPSLPQM